MPTCDHQLSAEDLPPDIQQISCDRSPWGEASDDKCILHTTDRVKATDELTEALKEATKVHGLEFGHQKLPQGFELHGCLIYKANFQNADISGCTFRGTEIRNSRLEGANLEGTSFLPDEETDGGVVRNLVDITSNNLTNADLSSATFREVNLMDSVLNCEDMRSVSFLDCALSELEFVDQKLRDSDFSYSLLRRTKFEDCDIHNGTFQASVLDGTHFVNTNLRAADLRNSILDQPEFDSVKVNHQTQFDSYLVQEYLADQYCQGELQAETVNDVREFLHNRRNHIPMDFEGLASSGGWDEKVTRSIRRFFAQRSGIENKPDIAHLVHARYRYRDLASIFSSNGEPEIAREYTIREKHAKRKNAFRMDGSSRVWLAFTRWTMTYGEEPTQPIKVAIAIIVLSAALYPIWGVTPTGSEQVFRYCLDCKPSIEGIIQRSIAIGELSIVRFFAPTNPSVEPIGFGVFLGLFQTIAGALLTAMFVFTLGRRATE